MNSIYKEEDLKNQSRKQVIKTKHKTFLHQS